MRTTQQWDAGVGRDAGASARPASGAPANPVQSRDGLDHRWATAAAVNLRVNCHRNAPASLWCKEVFLVSFGCRGDFPQIFPDGRKIRRRNAKGRPLRNGPFWVPGSSPGMTYCGAPAATSQLCQRNACGLRAAPCEITTLTRAGPRKFIASSSAPFRSFGSSTKKPLPPKASIIRS
jgi:hypothetical protein